MADEKLLIPASQMAAQAGVPTSWLKQEIAAGRLPGAVIGARVMCNPLLVEAAIMRLALGAAEMIAPKDSAYRQLVHTVGTLMPDIRDITRVVGPQRANHLRDVWAKLVMIQQRADESPPTDGPDDAVDEPAGAEASTTTNESGESPREQ